jgi:hypothetical protein
MGAAAPLAGAAGDAATLLPTATDAPNLCTTEIPARRNGNTARIDLAYLPSKIDELALLNAAGEDGWELVTITSKYSAPQGRVRRSQSKLV